MSSNTSKHLDNDNKETRETDGDAVCAAPKRTATDSLVAEDLPSDNGKHIDNDNKEADDKDGDAVCTAAKRTATASLAEDLSLSSPASKRLCQDNEAKQQENQVLDSATLLGLKAGDRLEVEWQIENNDNNNNNDSNTETRWWGCTLLEYNERTTEDSVAIHVLEYDAYPEGGFPEKSKEDVIFIGHDLLVNPVTEDENRFRREGREDVFVTTGRSRSDVENVVNTTLMNAMQNNSTAWENLPRAQQGMIADIVASKKEMLVNRLMAHLETRPIVTSADMQSILQQTMQEDAE